MSRVVSRDCHDFCVPVFASLPTSCHDCQPFFNMIYILVTSAALSLSLSLSVCLSVFARACVLGEGFTLFLHVWILLFGALSASLGEGKGGRRRGQSEVLVCVCHVVFVGLSFRSGSVFCSFGLRFCSFSCCCSCSFSCCGKALQMM